MSSTMRSVCVALAIVAGVVLLGHWRVGEHKAVWGGAALGAIVGLVVGPVKGDPGLLALSYAAGTFAGVAFERIGRIAKRLRNR
jgi:hypothetical protein